MWSDKMGWIFWIPQYKNTVGLKQASHHAHPLLAFCYLSCLHSRYSSKKPLIIILYVIPKMWYSSRHDTA